MSEYDPAVWDQWMQGAASPALIPARWRSFIEFVEFSCLAETVHKRLEEGWEIAQVNQPVSGVNGRYCIISRRPPKFEERNG